MKKLSLIALLILTISYGGIGQELPIQDTSKVVNVDKKVLESYLGTYSFKTIGIKVEFLMDNDQFVVSVPGTGQFQLIPGSKRAFRVRELGIQLEFAKNSDGPVKLFQGGGVFDGEKVEASNIEYTAVRPGDPSIDYTKLFTPFTAEWDLLIRDKKVGTATTKLRHTVFNGEPAYRGGSVIRYESMDNMPFDDIGIFSKKTFAKIWARNAISQEDEITSTMNGKEIKLEYLNTKTGKVGEIKIISFEEVPMGAGIYLFLASDIKIGMSIKYPVAQIEQAPWVEAQVVGKETIHLEALNKTFDAWKIEYSSGTIHWIVDEAPYMVKWKMPTGMEWKLTNYGN